LLICPRVFRVGYASTIVCALLSCASSHAAGLNDTGISCETFTVSTRGDCRHGRDAADALGALPKIGGGSKGFDFSKIANDGTVLPATSALGTGAKDWACTRDNVTGLVWEVKTTSGLRNQVHTYTWYNSNQATNGGAVGTTSGGTCNATGRCDTEKFTADVNASALCSATDWRMPTVKELEGLVDFGSGYGIDPIYFLNTTLPANWSGYFLNAPNAVVWSGSPMVGGSAAWKVSFLIYTYWGYLSGYTEGENRSKPLSVRLVRGGP
jgi:hypothetical protein